MEGLSVELRMRLSAADAHYGGSLVDGAHGLEIFGDIVTELVIHTDGDEGLFAGYEKVEFLAPLHAGDFVRATGTIVRMGTTSRTVDLELWKQVAARPDISDSAADWPSQTGQRTMPAMCIVCCCSDGWPLRWVPTTSTTTATSSNANHGSQRQEALTGRPRSTIWR